MSNVNAFASAGVMGVSGDTQAAYLDRPFSYVYDVTLTALQTLLNQSVPIMTDSDFILRGIYVSFATGLFEMRFSDASSYYFSNGLINVQNFSFFAGQPWPVVPEVWYPAGGKIGIDIADTSGNSNTVEIVFVGVKRFPVC